MQKKKVFGFILMLIAVVTISFGCKTANAATTPKLMTRESSTYVSGTGDVYYAIGASRSGNTKYTADLISTITFVTNKNVPNTAEASWDASYTSGDGEVIAWVIPNSTDSTKYDLYIGADGEKIEAPINSNGLFENYTNCVSINDLRILDTSSVTNMSSMFSSCSSLTSLNVSSLDTSKVTNMSFMFYGCSRLTSLNVSSFDTSKVTNMMGMFAYCSNLTSIILDKSITSSDQAMKLSIGTGLDSLSNAVLYVPDVASEKLYEKATNYSTAFKHSDDTSDDLYRIRPLLEVAGNNPINVMVGETYNETVDDGVTIAGFAKANASEYTQYGYGYTVTGLPVDTSSAGTKQVTYTLTKTQNGTTTNGMTATRDVKILTIPKLMEREAGAYISENETVYYSIGAKRSGNTKYTADLISTITFVTNKNVPDTAEASWDVSYTSGDTE